MLLSQESILYHNKKDKEIFNRYDRVQEFVNDQVRQHFKSMDQSNNNHGQVPAYPASTVGSSPTSINTTPSEAHIPTTAESVKTRKRNNKKDDTKTSSRLPFPQMKKHGLHLLEKFTSPNLVIDRVTHKQNLKHTSIGIFNKGKSSAKGKIKQGVADLLFSENDFLNPLNQTSASDKTEVSESPYFQSKDQRTKPTSQIGKKRKLKENPQTDNLPQAKSTLNREEFMTPLKRRKHVVTPISPPPLSVVSSKITVDSPKNYGRLRTDGRKNTHRPRKTSDDSFDSIKQLLQECQEAPQLETSHHPSAGDYIWCPSASESSKINSSYPRRYMNEHYLPSEYMESASSLYSPITTDRQSPARLFQIDDSNSDILSPLKTLYEGVDDDDGLKNFWKNQNTRKL